MHAWASRAYHAQITLSGLARTGGTAMVRAILAKPYASRVAVEPLSPTQSTAMARDLLETAAIPPEVEELVSTKIDGNPLFIEELLRSLLKSAQLVTTKEHSVCCIPPHSTTNHFAVA
jgi:predicted ATPase